MIKKLLFILFILLLIWGYKNMPKMDNQIEFDYAYIITNPNLYHQKLNNNKKFMYDQGLTLTKEITYKNLNGKKETQKIKEYHFKNKTRIEHLSTNDKEIIFKNTVTKKQFIYYPKKQSAMQSAYSDDDNFYNVNNKHIVTGEINYKNVPCKVIQIYDSNNVLTTIMYVSETLGLEFYVETFKENPLIYKIKDYKVGEINPKLFE